jgi:5-methylthioribose kinase
MSLEESNKMSQKTRSQDSLFEDVDANWEKVMENAGQDSLPYDATEMWEMERRLWQQRQSANLDEPSY